MESESSMQKSLIVLHPEQAIVIESALQQWSSANLISSTLATELLSTIQIQEQGFDWEKFTKYSFRLAVLCLAIAAASLVFDSLFLKFISKVVNLPPKLRSVLTASGAIAVHFWAFKRSLITPQQIYSNEAIHGAGAILSALATLQVAEAMEHSWSCSSAHHRDKMINLLVLLLAMIYCTVGLLAKSNFLWSCGILVFAAFLGAQTGYFFGGYYLGIEYPIKFILAGIALLSMAYVMPGWIVTAPFWRTTRIWGLLYVFIALWILSIFGLERSKGGLYLPGALRSSAFWSISFLAAAIFSTWHGLYYGVSTTKGFGLTFIGINLYTKFFELCWNNLYKPLFFTIIALTLAIVGNYTEIIWGFKASEISNRP